MIKWTHTFSVEYETNSIKALQTASFCTLHIGLFQHLSGESDRQHEMNEALWHLHTPAGRDLNQLGAAGPFAQLIKSVCKRQTAANASPTNCNYYCSITVKRISWTFLQLAIKDFLEEAIKWKNMIHEVTGEVVLFSTK